MKLSVNGSVIKASEHLQLSRNFNSREFDSPDIPFSGTLISREVVECLQYIRDMVGVSLYINSGVRSKSHNINVGGVSDSEHTTFQGVDIACRDSATRNLIIKHALIYGCKRIGISSKFIHLGFSKSKPQGVIWTY